jgi:tRNA pseudouridine38-40 synthase
MKRRIALHVSYDGTSFAGWQRQKNAFTVQEALENALYKVLSQRVPVTGGSRTDAGVHALGQVAHFDTDSSIPPDRFAFALNVNLEPSIRVRQSLLADDLFHARYSAQQKVYCYLVHNAPHASAILRDFGYHIPYPLDVDRMRAAAGLLVGEHDFKAFMSAGSTDVKSTVRTIFDVTLRRVDDEVLLWIRGSGFLYNMVRIIAGTLLQIGRQKMDADCFARAMETGERRLLGPTAPARGLTLIGIYYDGQQEQAIAAMRQLPLF